MEKNNNLINVLIGKELKIARLQKRITQTQVGEYMGVSRQMVSMWENGSRAMNIDDYLKLCDHFGFDAFGMIHHVMEIC